MIDLVTGEELRRLGVEEAEHCVSIYLPTHPFGGEAAQDPIRLKNLVTKAVDELEALGVRRPDALDRLAGVDALMADGTFTSNLESGLALFIDGDGLTFFRTPETVVELVVVADHFHLTPLLPFAATGEGFYILSLSENQVRLLRASRYRAGDIALRDIPESLSAALRFDDREAQLHSHGADRVGRGEVSATFHGHGVATDFDAKDRERFLQMVDHGVCHILGNSSDPLMLAGVDDIVSRFRKLSEYRYIVEGSVEGNAEHLSSEQLHDRAWPLVAPRFDIERAKSREAIVSGTGSTATSLSDAVVAATSGRVSHIFVPNGRQHWGSFDSDNASVEVHEVREPGDRDLTDIAAIETLVHGGRVFAVDPAEIPGGGDVAAVLRF